MASLCIVCDEPVTLETKEINGKTQMLNGVKFRDKIIVWHYDCIAAISIGFYAQRYVTDEKIIKMYNESVTAIRQTIQKIRLEPDSFINL